MSSKKLLEAFVDEKFILKEAAIKDLSVINNYLKSKICSRFSADEIHYVNSIASKLENIINNPEWVIKDHNNVRKKYFMFGSSVTYGKLDIHDMRELLRNFAKNTIKAIASRNIQVECQDEEGSLIVECAG